MDLYVPLKNPCDAEFVFLSDDRSSPHGSLLAAAPLEHLDHLICNVFSAAYADARAVDQLSALLNYKKTTAFN